LWTCTTVNHCSAAAGHFYCACDHKVFAGAAGCPGRQFGTTLNVNGPVDDEEPCDPDNPEAFRLDVIVRGVGFEMYSGREVFARGLDPVLGQVVMWPNLSNVTDGGFQFSWHESFSPQREHYELQFYVDTNGNRHCDEGVDLLGGMQVTNTAAPGSDDINVQVSLDVNASFNFCSTW